jgi:23S rRNA pseudouridine955/2504/2580 synthase
MAVSYRVAGKNDAGQRIDNYLVSCLKGIPNKGRVRADYRLVDGDSVRIPPFKVEEKNSIPAHVAALGDDCILYEDDDYCVINKPAGIPVHSGSGHQMGVVDMMRARGRDVLYLAHRLDKEVSGCLLFCKSRGKMVEIQDVWSTNLVRKFYHAIVFSAGVQCRSMHVDLPLRNKAGGYDEALSRVDVLRQVGDFALVMVEIETGRKHQIRRHLAAVGMPILGDDKYGAFDENRQASKMLHEGELILMLNSHRLLKKNKSDGVDFDVTAPYSGCFGRTLELLGLH